MHCCVTNSASIDTSFSCDKDLCRGRDGYQGLGWR
ncbi:unnamed protein product, partial [Amoebophrya sp. A120]|eukprot:GSA120T00007616001.1